MDKIIVQLSYRKKHGKSQQEWRKLPVAYCDTPSGRIEVEGDGPLIRKLLQEVKSLFQTATFSTVEVYRGLTLVFEPTSLESWVNPPNRMPLQLRKDK